MNKFLITLATLVAFSLNSVAFAVEANGFMQRIIGMGDDVDGGVTETFTRFGFSADTTTDNGWTVGGNMTIQTAAATGGAAAPSANYMYVQTDMMTVNIGNTVGANTSLIPAVSGMVPGGGVDAGYQFLFDGGNLGVNAGQVGFREAYYASNAAKIDIDLPSVNGFTVGVSYTPSEEFRATTQARQQAEAATVHGETIEVGAKYSGEMDGMTYDIGVGVSNGNSRRANSASARTYP